MPTTVGEAVQGPQISALRRNCPTELNASLAALTMTSMPPHQQGNENVIVTVAKHIRDKYWYLRLSEIAMVLQKGMCGLYGNLPSGSNPLLAWLTIYDQNERLDFCEAQATSKNESYLKEYQRIELRESNRKNEAYKSQIEKEWNFQAAKDLVNQQRAKLNPKGK